MKYKITESQQSLINGLKARKQIKEQDFIMQSFHPTANEGNQRDVGRDWYTIEVTILGGLDGGEDVSRLDDKAYFKMAIDDAKVKIAEAFHTHEFTINSISNKTRGEVNPLYLG